MEHMRIRNGHNRMLDSELDEAKSEIKVLQEIIDKMEKDEEKIYYKLQAENDELKLKIPNILRCGECDIQFKDKASLQTHISSNHFKRVCICNTFGNNFETDSNMKTHILTDHGKKIFKCGVCERNCRTEDDLKVHMKKEHSNRTEKQNLMIRHEELILSLKRQKIKIFEDLYKLKALEVKQLRKCGCKGNFCRIDHSRFRWTASKSDAIFNIMISTSSSFPCEKCDKIFYSENNLRSHINNEHEQKFICKQCDKAFSEVCDMIRH